MKTTGAVVFEFENFEEADRLHRKLFDLWNLLPDEYRCYLSADVKEYCFRVSFGERAAVEAASKVPSLDPEAAIEPNPENR